MTIHLLKAAAPEPLYVEPHKEADVDVTGKNELFEETQHASRTKAIAAKTKEIEQVSRNAFANIVCVLMCELGLLFSFRLLAFNYILCHKIKMQEDF